MDYDDYFQTEEHREESNCDGAQVVEREKKTGSSTLIYLPYMGAVTFDEAHSATLGFALCLLLVVSGLTMWWQTLALVVAVMGVKSVGKRLSELVDRYFGYAVREAHWLLGGGALGTTAGVALRTILVAGGGV